jgi:hypothetical protein
MAAVNEQWPLTIEISKIKIGERFRKDVGDVSSLATSIDRDGLYHPIGIDEDNNLIFGFRRIKAFELLGKAEIPYTRVNIKNALQAEYDENVERKNFTITEIADIYKAVQASRIGHRPKKGAESAPFPRGKTREVTAKIAGRGKGEVKKIVELVDTVKESPDKKIDSRFDTRTYAELLRDVDNDKTKLSKGYNIIKKDMKYTKVKAEIDEATKGLGLPSKVTLLNKDSTRPEEITEIKDNSAVLIITDPPYGREYLDCYDGLAKFASHKLKEGGSVVFMFGEYFLPEVINIFSRYTNLRYWWTFKVKMNGPNLRCYPKGVIQGCKLMLWYVKGNKRLTDTKVVDFIESNRPNKDRHDWAQNPIEAEYLIKHLTTGEFSLVVDPFLGSGEFAIPAIQLHRYFVGIEIDRNTFEDAKKYIMSESMKKNKREE